MDLMDLCDTIYYMNLMWWLLHGSCCIHKVVAEVTVSAEAATIVKNEVQVVKDKAQKIVEGIEKEKAMAKEKLEAAQPALEEAEAALNVRFVWLEHLCIYTIFCIVHDMRY